MGLPSRLVASCVWKVSAELVVALDGRFGEPVDTYVNGSQVWLRDDGPGGIALEWRLHPVAGYVRPAGMATDEVFARVALSLGPSGGDEPGPAPDPAALWDGLEAFPAYGDEAEPAELSRAAAESLGLTPDACGLVDHDAVGDAWERSRGAVSIVDLLIAQLRV